MARHSKDRLSQWYDYNLNLETRTFYLGDGEDGEIDKEVARNVIKAFHLFDTGAADKPVNVILNSFGGCWYNGMAIFDIIQQSKSHVNIYGVGAVMSMGSVIMQAADTRWMYPNATMMVHDGSEVIEGATRTVLNWARNAEEVLSTLYRIYSYRSGKPVSFWKKRCAHDAIFTAHEAKEHGLIDHIVGEDNNG